MNTKPTDKISMLPEEAPDDPEQFARWLVTKTITAHIQAAYDMSGYALAFNAPVSALYSFFLNQRDSENFNQIKAELARVLRATADLVESADEMAAILRSHR